MRSIRSVFLLFLCQLILCQWAIVGCAAHKKNPAPPVARPLGGDLRAYQAPHNPDQGLPKVDIEEPEGELSLQQALALALMTSPELASYSWGVRAAEARTLQAGLLPNPEFEVEIEEVPFMDLPSNLSGGLTTIQLGQLVELGGKRRKRVQLAALEQDLAGWDYETRRLAVLTEVTKFFVEVLAAQESRALAEELFQLSERVYQTAAERVQAGKVSPLEETRAGVVLSTSRIGLNQARRNLTAARKLLASRWGSRAPQFERVVGELEDLAPMPEIDQLEALMAQNPEVARWAVELEQRQAALRLEKASAIPDLSLRGGMQRLGDSQENGLIVGLSIPLPVFDRNQGGVLEARYEVARAKNDAHATAVRVGVLLTEVYQELAVSHAEAYALKRDVLPAAQHAFDAASEGYRLGKFRFLEVLDAQRTLFEVKGHYVDALATYHKAVADLEGLIGSKLETPSNHPDQQNQETDHDR